MKSPDRSRKRQRTYTHRHKQQRGYGYLIVQKILNGILSYKLPYQYETHKTLRAHIRHMPVTSYFSLIPKKCVYRVKFSYANYLHGCGRNIYPISNVSHLLLTTLTISMVSIAKFMVRLSRLTDEVTSQKPRLISLSQVFY